MTMSTSILRNASGFTFACATIAATLSASATTAATTRVTTMAELSAAVAAAAVDDIIEIQAGTYRFDATLTFNRNNLTLRGVTASGANADPRDVVLSGDTDGDGTPDVQLFYAKGKTGLLFENLTFACATADQGGAVKLENASARAEHCIFRDNVASGTNGAGGAVWVSNLTFTAIDCEFSENTALRAGAIYTLRGTIAATNSIFSLNSCTIESGTSGGGGAMEAISASTYYPSLYLYGCTFSTNTSCSSGGAVQYPNANVVKIDHCIFRGNRASATQSGVNGAGSGGAIFAKTATATDCSIRNSLFIDNQADTILAPASMNRYTYGGAIRMTAYGIPVENCTFIGNKSLGAVEQRTRGGALSGNIAATNCVFYRNRTAMTTPSTTPSWWYANIHSGDNAYSLIANCLEMDDSDYPDFHFNDIDTGDLSKHIKDGVNGNKVGDYDPLFTDAANDDYSLQEESPCLDAGASLHWMADDTKDLAGRRRVVGDFPDIGAYEWYDLATIILIR